MTRMIAIALLLAITCLIGRCTPPDNTLLALNSPLNISEQAGLTYGYFQTVIANPAEYGGDALLITVSSDISDYIQIYVITSVADGFDSESWPTADSPGVQQCSDRAIDTCAVLIPESFAQSENFIVYFSVRLGSTASYTLEVQTSSIYGIQVGHQYTVKLAKAESALLRLGGEQFIAQASSEGSPALYYDEITLLCNYNSYKTLGQFQLVGSLNAFPDSQQQLYEGESLRAFQKILALPTPSPTVENSTYYIIVEGQLGTSFNISVAGISMSEHEYIDQNGSFFYQYDLALNSSISYLIKYEDSSQTGGNKDVRYAYAAGFPLVNDSSQISSLYIDLFAYRGWGQFKVDYCNSLYISTFENTGGENAEVIITPDMRMECQAQEAGGLLIETVDISIENVFYEFGYGINFYEASSSDFEYMIMGYRQYGALDNVDNTNKKFKLGLWGTGDEFSVNAQTLSGVLAYTISQCNDDETDCDILANAVLTENDTLTALEFSVQPESGNGTKDNYVLEISMPIGMPSQPLVYYYYQAALTHQAEPSQLAFNTHLNDIVEENEYNFYYINVSELRAPPMAQQIGFDPSATLLTIKLTTTNGEVTMFVSATDSKPTLDTFFNMSSGTDLAFSGRYEFTVNSTFPTENLYIGVLGDVESIYSLQFVVDGTADIPARYISLSENAQNDFTISAASPYVLVKYTAHIVPYTIVFSPEPSCIRFGGALPLAAIPQCNNINLPSTFTDPVLYFNISSLQANQQLKFSVYVNSGNYLLAEDTPVLVGCEAQCYETIIIVIKDNSGNNDNTTLVMHSGQGSISILPGNTQTTSNGILSLECAAPPCSFSLNASISSTIGGSMEVSYLASWAGRMEWRTKPMQLPTAINQPRHFYSKVSQYDWDPNFDASFVFYSEGMALTIAYSLQVLDESASNTMQFVFPSLAYNPDGTYTMASQCSVSTSIPLSPTHIVTVPKSLLTQNNCYFSMSTGLDSAKICLITFSVYINPNVEYSNQFINTGVGFYSANNYFFNEFDNIELNAPISLQEVYGIANFQFPLLAGPLGAYRIHLKPVSNCRPLLQLESDEYLVNYYLGATLPAPMPGQEYINYRVVSTDNCLFQTMITQSQYPVLFANILYEGVQAGTFLYTHTDSAAPGNPDASFYVDTAIKAIQITVCLYNEPNNCPVQVSNVSRVLVTPPSDRYSTTFLIKVDSKAPISIIAQKLGIPTTLLHNQEATYKYDPYDNSAMANANPIVQYRYHTLRNILLFVEVNRFKVNLTVYDADSIWSTPSSDAMIFQTILTNFSEPWVVINNPHPNRLPQQMANYLIQFEFLGELEPSQSATLRLHIEEDGLAGLPNLYMGINKYDAFLHADSMNCYQFNSQMLLGDNNLHIDLHFPSLTPTESQQKQIQSETQDFSILQDNIRVVVTNNNNHPTLNQQQTMISPQTLRIAVNYYSSTTYKVCYTLQGSPQQLLGAQYSTIVNMPSVPMLYRDQYLYNSNLQDNLQFLDQPFQMFEYINYDSDPLYQEELTITVTNCLGRVNLLASSSYQDMLTGQLTQILAQDLWSNNGITVGLVDVRYGYYYIGLADADPTAANVYKLEVSRAVMTSSGPIIAEKEFTINWAIKAKAYPLFKESNEYVVISIPTVIRTPSSKVNIPNLQSVLGVEAVQYELYLMNLADPTVKKLKYRIDSYSRCPHLLPFETHSNAMFKPSQIRNVTKFDASNPETIQFELPIELYEPNANISVKAQVFIKSQVPNSDQYSYRVLTYYYGSDEIEVVDGDSNGSLMSPLKWILCVMAVFASAAGCAFFLRWFAQRRRNQVDFEMAQFAQGQEMETRTNRRPINNDTGYGEFVDESLA